jgi:hypothetical protein
MSLLEGVLTFGVNERVFDGFCAEPGAFAPRCSVSRKKSNADLYEIGKNTPFSLNVNTPKISPLNEKGPGTLRDPRPFSIPG